MTIRTHAFAVALLTVALAACSSQEAPAVTTGEGGEAAVAPRSSSAGLPAGNAEAGKTLAAAKNATTGQSCIDCHGAEGNAPIDPTYPKIGGQYADYLSHALLAYRKGDRDHALMASQAKTLTDQQIADLGVYFASVPSQIADLDRHTLQ
jgi:cytochrome c553